jgi:siroheme synthase (precorrin-2 oxidase/ferrochelatase)
VEAARVCTVTGQAHALSRIIFSAARRLNFLVNTRVDRNASALFIRPSTTEGALVLIVLHAVSTTSRAWRLFFPAPGFIGVSVSPGATEKIRSP